MQSILHSPAIHKFAANNSNNCGWLCDCIIAPIHNFRINCKFTYNIGLYLSYKASRDREIFQKLRQIEVVQHFWYICGHFVQHFVGSCSDGYQQLFIEGRWKLGGDLTCSLVDLAAIQIAFDRKEAKACEVKRINIDKLREYSSGYWVLIDVAEHSAWG